MRKANTILFTVAFFSYALLAAVAIWRYNLAMGDAVARTANAAYVLFSRNPHYGAIGTVWPPLTSTLQVPLVWFFQVTLGYPQFAGNILSALAGASNLVLLRRLFQACGLGASAQATLLALYALNTMVLFYA